MTWNFVSVQDKKHAETIQNDNKQLIHTMYNIAVMGSIIIIVPNVVQVYQGHFDWCILDDLFIKLCLCPSKATTGACLKCRRKCGRKKQQWYCYKIQTEWANICKKRKTLLLSVLEILGSIQDHHRYLRYLVKMTTVPLALSINCQ